MPVRNHAGTPLALRVMDGGVLRRCRVYIMDGGVLRTIDLVSSIAISPPDRYWSRPAGGDQTTFSLVASGGTPSAISWSIQSSSGGNWAISGGQGTSTVTVSVNGVLPGIEGFATIQVQATVAGQVLTATAFATFFNSSFL